MRIYSNKNVFEAGLDRIRNLFDDFEEIIVGFSGGKDSTVVLNLCLIVAKEKNRLPLKVMFLDQEAEWENVINYQREIMNRPDIKPLWFQMPIKIFNATSEKEPWLMCWEEGIIGVSNDNKLKALWFVYGDCYSASKEIYERIRNKISKGINELQNVEFSETNELGRVNKVDPLGITYLRIRGMWGIENPIKVFDYIIPEKKDADFFFNAIVLKEKYLSFPVKDRKNLETLVGDKFSIKDIKIKSPNNPAKLLDAKLLSFVK